MRARMMLQPPRTAGSSVRLSLVLAGHAAALYAAAGTPVDPIVSGGGVIDTIPWVVPAPRRLALAAPGDGVGLPGSPGLPTAVILPHELPILDHPFPGVLVDVRRWIDTTARIGSGGDDLVSPAPPRHAGEVDLPPALASTVTPEYPPALEGAGVEGRVILEFVVDTAGRVVPESVRVVVATNEGFVHSARAAIVAEATFRPGRHRGVAVPTVVRQAIVFRMNGRASGG